jgi:8-oxo-dGTP pyrophosphatase MutT (NUDIX family)
VRDGGDLEVLMVQRPDTARFMPGAWVFPGGAVDVGDATPPRSFGTNPDEWAVAAARELIEETGIWLTTSGAIEQPPTEDAFGAVEHSDHIIDLSRLIYFSNWITPEVFPIRFDTRFFLAVVEAEIEGSIDGDELVDLVWVNPMEALGRERSGEWSVAFPTRETLRLLGTEQSASAIAERLRALGAVPAIEPRLFVSGSEARILMPDDPGFEAAGPDQKDPTILDRLAEVVAGGGMVPAEFKDRR